MTQIADWLLTPERVAIHRPTATAVVADLHLGYAQARQRRGDAVPVPPLATVLSGLRRAVERTEARRLVIAGDLFEEGRYAAELAPELRRWLDAVGLELIGVAPGNHDRGLATTDWPWRPDGVELGQWRIVHGDAELPAGAVVHGHVHPCLRWGGQAAPCYLATADRLVLPAFSTDAAGGNVLGDGKWREYRCLTIVGGEVLDFGIVGEMRRTLTSRGRLSSG